MHASSSQFASVTTPLHRYAPWVVAGVLLLHVLSLVLLMKLVVPNIEPPIKKSIQVRIVQPEVPKQPVAAVVPPKPQPKPKPKPEVAKLPPKIIATAKPIAKAAAVVPQATTKAQPVAPVVPVVVTPAKEPVNNVPPVSSNNTNTKAAAEPVVQGPKNVSIGGDGIQWSRSPKPNYTNRDLDGKNRTVVIAIQAEANGSIQNVRIKQSSGLAELDEKCLRAVRNAKFKPYKVNGTAIATVTELPLLLNLNPDG